MFRMTNCILPTAARVSSRDALKLVTNLILDGPNGELNIEVVKPSILRSSSVTFNVKNFHF